MPAAEPTALPSRAWLQEPLPQLNTAPTDWCTGKALFLVTQPTLGQKQALWGLILLSLTSSDSCNGISPPVLQIKGRCEILRALGCYHK